MLPCHFKALTMLSSNLIQHILCGLELGVFGLVHTLKRLIVDKRRYTFCQLKNSGRL